MPKVTRWFIKVAILYVITGVFLALMTEIPAVDTGPLLLPVYGDMLVMGWITQVIMGVSIWMFPKFLSGNRRGPEWAGRAVILMFNIGLIVYLLSILTFPGQKVILAISGRGLILLSILNFAGLIWKRVVSYRR